MFLPDISYCSPADVPPPVHFSPAVRYRLHSGYMVRLVCETPSQTHSDTHLLRVGIDSLPAGSPPLLEQNFENKKARMLSHYLSCTVKDAFALWIKLHQLKLIKKKSVSENSISKTPLPLCVGYYTLKIHLSILFLIFLFSAVELTNSHFNLLTKLTIRCINNNYEQRRSLVMADTIPP